MINTGKWIVFLGVPGCGKGTQSELLVKSEFKFKTICAGDVLRSNKELFVPQINKTVGEIIGSGMLLPDFVIVKLIHNELDKIDNVRTQNILFDGFPRTVPQAEELSKISKSFGIELARVINFEIPDEILLKRIIGRFKCKNCGKIYNEYFCRPIKANICDICSGTDFIRREDDNETSLNVRLTEYYSKTQPLIEFYQKLNILSNIDANQNADSIYNALINIIGLAQTLKSIHLIKTMQ